MEPIFPSPQWGKRGIGEAEIEKRLLMPKERLVQ